jgi:hypothetical protein
MDDSSEQSEGRTDEGRFAVLRHRAEAAGERATQWFESRRAERVPYDLAASFYERDREAFASVLGAAVALRLFLFVVAISLLLAGSLLLVAGSEGIRELLSQANVTGSLAGQIGGAAKGSRSAGVSMVLLGLWLTLTNGRKLANVLAACSASAWHMDARQARPTLRMAAGVTTLVMILMLTASVLNRIREATGLGVETVSWAAATVVFGIGWFTVSWTLPRGTTDPGALLPGAALVGSMMAVLQWFMQFYLPTKIARSSEVMGSLGFTVATLGYMFVIGRLMAASLMLNAVVWERLGSVSGLVFSLPVLRRLPARSPRLASFFDLDRTSEDAS